MHRWLALVLFALCLSTTAAPVLAADPPAALDHSITVPFDYAHPADGSASLTYELGAPFDPRKPTVLVIADGQQYFVRQGAMAALQKQLFGDGVNVVGIITRGTTPAFMARAVGADGKPDWPRAWRLFNSDQWIGDIDSVRRAVVGPQAKVSLYGRSGGAYLVHQYLAVHGDHVARAFTQSPVNPAIAHSLGIGLDRFWTTLAVEDPELRPLLTQALARHPEDRIRMLLTLQRQHFYVPAEQLKAERARLVRALAAGDTATYDQMRETYEVDGVFEQSQSNDWIAQNVRVLELIGPSGAFEEAEAGGVYPLVEPQRRFAGALLDLVKAGRIPAPGFDLTAPHRVPAEVFVLAARDDEAVDYRTALALAFMYPRGALFIADDNHTFLKLSGAGMDARLVRAFFEHGLGSPELAAARAVAEPYRWRE